VKTTLELPDDLVREIKLQAVMHDRSFKELVTELLRRGLSAEITVPPKVKPTASDARIVIDADGLPTFRTRSDATKPMISIEDAQALEQRALEAEDTQRAGLSS
jgi:plasmid stability protein